MERANKYIMKSLQNSTIGPILKEFNAGKYYSKLNFVFNVCLLSFECFTTGTDNRHDVQFIFH